MIVADNIILVFRLSYLAASWGGKDNGFGLSKCCSDEPISSFPPSATTLHFEFYAEVRTTLPVVLREPQSIIFNSLFMFRIDCNKQCCGWGIVLMPIRIRLSLLMPTGYPDTDLDPDPYLNPSSSLFTAVPVYIVYLPSV